MAILILAALVFILLLSPTSGQWRRAPCFIPTGDRYNRAHYRFKYGDNIGALSPGQRIASRRSIMITCQSDMDFDAVLKYHFSMCRNGRWFPSLPECISDYRRCNGVIPAVENALLLENGKGSYKHGAILSYTCFHGYHLLGNKNRNCQNGVWSEVEFECIAEDAYRPCLQREIQNGEVSLAQPSSGRLYSFTCHDGFLLEVEGNIICENGLFSPSQPRCKPELCPAIEHQFRVVARGVLPEFEFSHGEVIEISCPEGLLPYVGRRRTKCIHGNWNFIPSCFRPCVLPVTGSAIYRYLRTRTRVFNGETVTSGRIVTVTCPGNTRASRVSRCVRGTWRPTLSDDTCGEDTPISKVFSDTLGAPNVPVDVNVTASNDSASHQDGGKEIGELGNDTNADNTTVPMECTTEISCEENCTVPLISENTLVTLDTTSSIVSAGSYVKSRHTVTIYYPDGVDVSVTCVDGQWNSSFHTTTLEKSTSQEADITCYPPDLDDVIYTPVKVRYNAGDIIDVISCHDDMTLVGSLQMSCSPQGVWQGHAECAAFCANGRIEWESTSVNVFNFATVGWKYLGYVDDVEDCLSHCQQQTSFECRAVSVTLKETRVFCTLLNSSTTENSNLFRYIKGPWDMVRRRRCIVEVPSEPQNLRASPLSSTSIQVSWEAPLNPKGDLQTYSLIYYRAGTDEEKRVILPQTELRHVLTDLVGFQEYSFRIVAYNNNGPGMSSEEVVARTYSDIPSDSPSNFTLETVNSTSIVIRWQPPPPKHRNGQITAYKIRYRKSGDQRPEVVTTDGSHGLYALTNLEQGTEYQVRIYAQTVNGSGPATEWKYATTDEDDSENCQIPNEPAAVFMDGSENRWDPEVPVPNGERLHISCMEGEIIHDVNYIMCSRGKWDHDEPYCQLEPLLNSYET